MLYRGSYYGFNREAFAKKCNNKGPTLVLIKSEFGNVFGGYSSISWTTPPGEPSKWAYYQDPDAFIFSLTNGTKHV